jgi:hypothetical protein
MFHGKSNHMQPSDEVIGIDDLNPLDASMEAALELEEMRQDLRSSSPALVRLVELLRNPSPGFAGGDGISMLADVRSFALFKSLSHLSPRLKASDHEQMQKKVGVFLAEILKGVSEKNKEKILLAKKFCLALNTNLLAKQTADIYARRERSDARYIANESLP